MQNKNTSSQVFKSFRPSSRVPIKPDVQLNQNYKSLTNIPQTTRATENQFQIRVVEAVSETRRSNYHSIVTDKKYSILPSFKNENQPSLTELGLLNTERKKPKSILKQKNTKSTDHSDNLTFSLMVEDTRLLPRRNKPGTLQPIRSPKYVKGSPSLCIASSISPKRVSFNEKVHVQLIQSIDEQKPKKYSLADLADDI